MYSMCTLVLLKMFFINNYYKNTVHLLRPVIFINVPIKMSFFSWASYRSAHKLYVNYCMMGMDYGICNLFSYVYSRAST